MANRSNLARLFVMESPAGCNFTETRGINHIIIRGVDAHNLKESIQLFGDVLAAEISKRNECLPEMMFHFSQSQNTLWLALSRNIDSNAALSAAADAAEIAFGEDASVCVKSTDGIYDTLKQRMLSDRRKSLSRDPS